MKLRPIVYSIDPTPVWFFDGSGEKIHKPNPNKAEWDLELLNVYHPDGSYETSDLFSYDVNFMELLNEVSYGPAMMEALEYHYKRAKDPSLFIDHLKFELLNERYTKLVGKIAFWDVFPGVVEIIREWLKRPRANEPLLGAITMNGNLSDLKSKDVGTLVTKNLTFSDIFHDLDWKKYIEALEKCDPPLLIPKRGAWEFIGVAKKHKGVIGSWIYFLKEKGKIKRHYNDKALAATLNNEISGLEIGVYGRTLRSTSNEFQDNFSKQLTHLSGLG